MNNFEFNKHLKRAGNNTRSFEILYEYCIKIMKKHIIYRFGKEKYLSFLKNVPHDVFTKVIIENPPEKFKACPSKYLCKAAYHHSLSLLNLKDNCAEEYIEDCSYAPDYKEKLEFSSEEIEAAWNNLDEQSKYIVYLNVLKKYKLIEVASIMGLHYDNVRTKKSRALGCLRKAAKNSNIKIQKQEVYQ